VQRTENGRTGRVLSGWAVERSGGAMCGLHLARGDEERGFLGLASKPRSAVCEWFGLKTTPMVCEWFGLKTTRTVFTGLASNPVVMVFTGLTSKLVVTVSGGLASKPAVTVSDGLASKPATTVSSDLASKLAAMVSSGLASKPATTVSSSLASKPTVRVSPVWPQNWWRWFLLIRPQNRRSVSWLSLKTKVVEGSLIWASKSATLVW
jgi:hypothetical protein